MEGNRDEARRCLEIARNAHAAGQSERAEKFARKADALFASPEAKELLVQVLAAAGGVDDNEADAGASTSAAAGRSSPRARASPGRKPAAAATSSRAEPEYTAAQVELVKKIKK